MSPFLIRMFSMAIALISVGCGEVSQGDTEGKEGRACFSNGTCNKGLVCLSNLCIKATDSGVPDMAKDLPVPDAAMPDKGERDQDTLDGPVVDSSATDVSPQDSLLPDLTLPDMPTPDLPALDMLKPDTAVPDFPIPDLTIPDLQVVDQTVVPDQGTVITPKWITIKAGTFQMGSPSTELCRGTDETLHAVTLTNDFEIQNVEVTQGQFKALMNYIPSYFSSCGGSCPVEKVSWHEAVAYANALSSKAGLAACYSCTGGGSAVTCSETTVFAGKNLYGCPGYRLPTEAEWEVAYRAGTNTSFYNGNNNSNVCKTCSVKDAMLDAIGWYCANSSSKTHSVGQKKPNAWGLHDMGGNVSEWCHDWYGSYPTSSITDPIGTTGSSRTHRGGGWSYYAAEPRAATRNSWAPSYRGSDLGFRPVRTISPKPIAHWKLDTGSGIIATDSSGNKHHGKVVGAKWSSGVAGGALKMDGISNHVTTPYVPVFKTTDSFTVSLWFKTNASNTSYQTWSAARLETSLKGELGIWTYNDGMVRFYIRDDGNNATGVNSTGKFNDGVWHHVVGVRDVVSGLVTLYVDGKKESQLKNATNTAINASAKLSLTIGANNKSGAISNFFKGELDDVQVFDRALTANQVRLFYNSGPSCNDKIKNGHETDIDCGGPRCNKCVDTKKCTAATDCLGGICTGGVCKTGCVHQPVVKSCSKDSLGIDWCTIPSGCFNMGSPSTESCRSATETQHQVILTHDFKMAATETTQAQFSTLMGYSPSSFSTCGSSCPVESINWHEAAAYSNALSTKSGLAACYKCSGSKSNVSCTEAPAYTGSKIYACPGYRLPTEAEWEYSFRAGTITAYFSGANDGKVCTSCTTKDANLDSIGWYCANSSAKTHPVAKKTANAWGLYDQAGNVWEWCHDWSGKYPGGSVTDPVNPIGSPAARSNRGSSWYHNASRSRAAARADGGPFSRTGDLGFRPVRSVIP